jgi:CubicO group peptidase (beta-lactamase class C family)
MKKIFKIFLLTIAAVIIVVLAYILITFPPVMAGMAAKTMCSCVFLTGRDPQSVRDKELQVFPGLSSASIDVNADSTVTATVFWKTSKAIYRKGLGCTLLAEQPEAAVRAQRQILPRPPFNQDTIAWPTGNVVKDSVLPDVRYDLVEKAMADAFAEVDPEKPLNTHAVVVVYKNKIVGERYAEGFDQDSRLMGWSMTKSITNALVGILVKEGKLDIQKPAPVAEWQNDERNKITLNNLLQASSGLSWSESYFNPTADFHSMFIKSDDKGGYAASRKQAHEPGTFFQYSSGSTNIISRIIRQTVGDSAYYKFAFEKLFYKIGMNHAIAEPDASGTYVGSSYSFATARDWARFGMLYLNDGVWNGERILPEGWVKYTVTPGSAAEKGRYGALWWLNAGDTNNPSNRLYPELPTDAYWADGFEEQYVMVIPSRDLVVVRLGVSHHGFDFNNLVKDIIAALPAAEQ